MTKKALVLSGGGARGGYEIGVWKALKEIRYIPDIVTGTSVGALNGVMIAMGEERLAIKVWENMSMDTVFEKKKDKDINTINSVKDFALNLAEIGGIDPKPLKALLKKLADEEKIRNSKIEFGLVTTGLKPTRKVEIFVDEMEEGKVADYVLASSACFPIMKKYKIDDKEYMDGGYCDNIPINMAIRRGAKEIVVVEMPGMFKVKKIEDVNAKVHYIRPKYDLGNMMLFNQETSRKNIELGYLDAMKVFERLEGNLYTFLKGTTLKSLQYTKALKRYYKKVFTEIPSVGKLEKMANEKIIKEIRDYNPKVFDVYSPVLDILEMAANIYGVDYLKIYNLKSLTQAVMNEYKNNSKSEETEILTKMLQGEKEIGIENITNLLKGYDSKSIISYLVYLFNLEKLTETQKNQILVISFILPKYVLTSIYISAVLDEGK